MREGGRQVRGETFVHRGVPFARERVPDQDHGAPWEEYDGHGVITDWIDQDRDEEYADRAHYWILANDRGRDYRYYDVRASTRIAARDQWGISPEARAALARTLGREPEPAEITRAAVEQDYRYLRDYCDGTWAYVGVVVTIPGTALRASLWGVESCSTAYIERVSRELADQILDADLQPEYDRVTARLREIAAAAGMVLEVGS